MKKDNEYIEKMKKRYAEMYGRMILESEVYDIPVSEVGESSSHPKSESEGVGPKTSPECNCEDCPTT